MSTKPEPETSETTRQLAQAFPEIQTRNIFEKPGIALGRDSLVSPAFIMQMEGELQANAHKGDWRAWMPTKAQIWTEIAHHQNKLYDALRAGNAPLIREYSADLANLLMKCHEIHGNDRISELDKIHRSNDLAGGQCNPPVWKTVQDPRTHPGHMQPTPRRVGCAACDRGDYQLGHHHDCPKGKP